MAENTPQFLKTAGRILNSGQARTLVLTGNVYDLFCLSKDSEEDYVPLPDFLVSHWDISDFILVVYELNGPVRFLRDVDGKKVRDAWLQWRVGMDSNEIEVQRMLNVDKTEALYDEAVKVYDDSMRKALNNPTLALELLRQMCLCARTLRNGKRILNENLLILIEGADMLIPDAPIVNLSDSDRQRVSICHDWFSDPGFVTGGDSVILLAESRSLLNQRIARLPQLIEVEICSPGLEIRENFIRWFRENDTVEKPLLLWGTDAELAKLTAGLSIHALMQLLKGARHEGRILEQSEVIAKVEQFIQGQLGEETVEFKKPAHSLEDVVGFTRLKEFLSAELMPRFQLSGSEALPGAAVCGPIGGGKTFIFEAVAAELDMVVLVLKNIRSKWFGETDVIFERLRRVLNALSKTLIFIDEADTQLGGVGSDSHETERRLTGKIQGMMSDNQLRGRVFWLLVTARIHQLSPDLRRPGRVGDLIIPTLDPEGEDRDAFIRWMVEPVLHKELTNATFKKLDTATEGYSAAAFASIRSELKAKSKLSGQQFSDEDIIALIHDHLQPAITETRRYQTLQALVNCTRRSLLPDPDISEKDRMKWTLELKELESQGIN